MLNLNQVSFENGIRTISVTNSLLLNPILIHDKIKLGELFSISYGNDHHFKQGSESIEWTSELPLSEAMLNGELEAMLMRTEHIKGVFTDSAAFYEAVSDKLTKCTCYEPHCDYDNKKLVAADLEHPNQPRNSSRYAVFSTKCLDCKKPITLSTQFGSFSTTGLDELKQLVIEKSGTPVNFSKIITTKP